MDIRDDKLGRKPVAVRVPDGEGAVAGVEFRLGHFESAFGVIQPHQNRPFVDEPRAHRELSRPAFVHRIDFSCRQPPA